VDTSTRESNSTDSLGRRTGPRRQHTIEEKLRIVKETHVKGASVATVARRYDVNPNQVFAWRQMYRKRLANSRQWVRCGLQRCGSSLSSRLADWVGSRSSTFLR
jgi:transposase-like protein